MNKEFSKERYDFIIIDSGINTGHYKIKAAKYKGIHLYHSEENPQNLIEDLEIEDTIGHGTAIFYAIWKENKAAKILIVKVFDKYADISAELLVNVLKYINKNYWGAIINLSFGINYYEANDELKEICEAIINRGSIIVAAFANDGSISYPAAYANVIGVDISLNCQHIYEFEYVESELINVRGCGITHRLPWLNQEEKRVSGTSFACPYIASWIYKKMQQNGLNLFQAKLLLKESAKKVHKRKEIGKIRKPFAIKRAILFPFNKEMHSIVRFSELLQFELCGVYDSKYMGVCGKKTSVVLNDPNLKKDYMITDIEGLIWEKDFDTLILGHLKQLEKIVGKSYREEIFKLSQRYNKKIFMFDDWKCSENKKMLDNVYTPCIRRENVPLNHFGKLYKIGIPILCVTGTSSKQGKFTTQLRLRAEFQRRGYKVGQLGTEPSAQLFGMDEVYPMGYESTAYLEGMDEILMINYMLNKIQQKNPDIILIGSQSQTIAYDTGNLKYMPVHQNNLLYAADPDGFILICNYFDEDEYIQRSICYLNHFDSVNNVIAICVYPFFEDLQWAYLSDVKKKVSFQEAKRRADEISKKTGINTYVLGSEDEKIFDECLRYFTE